jgi:hypothetical protein
MFLLDWWYTALASLGMYMLVLVVAVLYVNVQDPAAAVAVPVHSRHCMYLSPAFSHLSHHTLYCYCHRIVSQECENPLFRLGQCR